MNTKKEFQLQKHQSKLDSYNNILLSLESKKNIIISQSQIQNTIIDNTNNINTNLELLNNTKYSLEAKLKNTKHEITTITNQIANNKNLYKELDKIRDNRLEDEKIIYKDEILRIEIETQNANDKYNKSIEKSSIDKITIYDNIKLLQNDLQLQNEIILQLQLIEHNSRKEILKQCHQKKKDKVSLLNYIENNKTVETVFINQIDSLETHIQNLLKMKTLIVEDAYDSNDVTNSKTLQLSNYYLEYKIDKTLSLNDKIEFINRIIIDYKNQLVVINRKYTKTQNNNNTRIKEFIDSNNTVNRVNDISYNDKFKIEKQKKANLENILHDMQKQYDTFEIVVIANIKNDLDIRLNELLHDSICANTRLEITKERIINNYNNDKIKYNEIIDENNSNIRLLREVFDNISKEIVDINDKIMSEDNNRFEIEKIDIEIKKTIEIIEQIKIDIVKL